MEINENLVKGKQGNSVPKLKVGLIINPWAGLGGSVALKGSDGDEIVNEALRRGALPKAREKVSVFLQKLIPYQQQLLFITYPMDMGEGLLNEQGFDYLLLNQQQKKIWQQQAQKQAVYTRDEDTRVAAKEMAQQGIDILIFAGGDGTARNVAEGLQNFPEQLCLGIPAGVKIHSGVFAINPASAADLLIDLLESNQTNIQQAEVRDIDEEQLRQGHLNSAYYAELWVPIREGLVQCSKQGSLGNLDSTDEQQELLVYQEIAVYLKETLGSDELLIVGAGRTTFAFKESLGVEATLLGVDVIQNGKLLIKDATEQQIKNLLALPLYQKRLQQCEQRRRGGSITIVVSVIGGQGCIFGRGNQQISADIIRQVLGPAVHKEQIIILASQRKISNLPGKSLFLDTGDSRLDSQLSGLWNVLVDYDTRLACRVRC